MRRLRAALPLPAPACRGGAARSLARGAAALLLAACSATAAVVLPPDEDVALAGTDAHARPELGPPPGDYRLSPFELTDTVSGLTRLRGSVGVALTNFGDTGRLVQNHRIASFQDLDGSGFAIETLATTPVWSLAAGLDADADYRLDTPGDAVPVSARYATDGPPHVRFRFDQALQPGQTSRTMFAVTADDLAVYGAYGAYLVVRDASGQRHEIAFDAYASFVPEPASAALLLAGLAVLGIARRRASCAAA